MSNRTSAIYQEALSELRERHSDEFGEIYRAKLKAAGVEPGWLVTQRLKQAILDYINDHPFCGRRELVEQFGVSSSSLSFWLKQLRDEGEVYTPGSGGRGYLRRRS